MVDLALFIFFIIDYDTIVQHSFNISLNFVPSTNSILVTAQNTAGMLASLALRGYLLWFINLSLTIYLFTQTFKVYDHNRTSQIGNNITTINGEVNKAFSNNEELQGHSIYKNTPIKAFENTQWVLATSIASIIWLLTHF